MLFYHRVESQITTADYVARGKSPKTKDQEGKERAWNGLQTLNQRQQKTEVKRKPDTERAEPLTSKYAKGGRQERVCAGTWKEYRVIAQTHNREAWPWRVSWVSK